MSDNQTIYEDDGRIIRFHVPYNLILEMEEWLHDNLGSDYCPTFNVNTGNGFDSALYQRWEDITAKSQEDIHKAFLRSTRAWMAFGSRQSGGSIVWLKPTKKKLMVFFKLSFHKA